MRRRYEDFRLDVTHEPWTPRFHHIACDHTYVLTDRANAEVTVLGIAEVDYFLGPGAGQPGASVAVGGPYSRADGGVECVARDAIRSIVP